MFNQSPRMWRPTRWKQDDIAEFLSLMDEGPDQVGDDPRGLPDQPGDEGPRDAEEVADSLIHALRMGDEIGADGVVFHPGSTVGEPLDEALDRVGETIRHALAESEACPLLLENTAGAGGTIGRAFEELRELIELGGGGKRLGVCLDSCHMFAIGLRHHDGGQARRGGRRVRVDRRARAAPLPARERLDDGARLEPRPPRDPGRGRDRARGLRGVPLGAALREAARAASRAPARAATRRTRSMWTR